MYPEVYFPKERSLHWNGVEAQCLPSATMAHCNLLALLHNKWWHDPLGTLEGDHRTRANLGYVHNLIGSSQVSTTKVITPQKVTRPFRVRGSKSNKLRVQAQALEVINSQTLASTYHRGEFKLMHQMQWQVHRSQTPPNIQKLLGA
jgi:hypothetical protein